MNAPSDHLLRTMAAVPVQSYILDLGCGAGRHTEPLLRLGFPVHGCDPNQDAVASARDRVAEIVGDDDAQNCVQVAALDEIEYPDDAFDWVIAYEAERFGTDANTIYRLLMEARRMLKPGGWAYVTFPAAPTDVDEQEQTAGDGAPPATDTPEETPSGRVSIDLLEAQQERANFATASAPEVVEENGEVRIRAIFRRVESNTPV